MTNPHDWTAEEHRRAAGLPARATREPIAYLAHPLGAANGRQWNINRAMRWGGWVASHGVAVVADWIWLAQIWDETPANRRRGLEIDCRLVEACDVVLHVGGRISDGMRIEGDHARACGVPVIDLTGLGDEPPQFGYPLLARIQHALAKPVCPVCVGKPEAREIDGCSGCGLPFFPGETTSSPSQARSM